MVGAGFSASLGFPLTDDLLWGIWNRINDKQYKDKLKRVIEFHHPEFEPSRRDTFPNIEQFLSQLIVNEELFDSSRQYEGKFTKRNLEDVQHRLLLSISDWFHELSNKISLAEPNISWLRTFRDRVKYERAVIISFNWDLILDELIFGQYLNKDSYGFSRVLSPNPVLLKPHGSLNWFERDPGRFITDRKRISLVRRGTTRIYAFREFRAPVSKIDRVYVPLIIPPVYFKKFDNPAFHKTWMNCTKLLSAAEEITFIGYSMPEMDVHARFILRCGFHNQMEGELRPKNQRSSPSGPARVIIINPDKIVAQRISTIAGPTYNCRSIYNCIEDFVWDDP